jgi:hypothetical protein
MRHPDQQRRAGLTSRGLAPIAGRTVAMLGLALVGWCLPSVAQASCGDWLAGTHASPGEDHSGDWNPDGAAADRAAASPLPERGFPAPERSCQGLRCSDRAPAPAPSAPPPTLSIDHWAWLDPGQAATARRALIGLRPPAVAHSEHHGADVFRPPRSAC